MNMPKDNHLIGGLENPIQVQQSYNVRSPPHRWLRECQNRHSVKIESSSPLRWLREIAPASQRTSKYSPLHKWLINKNS